MQSGKLKDRSQIHWVSADESQTRSKAHISNSEVVQRNRVFSTGFILRLCMHLKDFPELIFRKRMKSQFLISGRWGLV